MAQIGAEAIRRNLLAIRGRTGEGIPVCAAVKADAYGHGLGVVLPVLAEAGVEQVAVANLDEATNVRELGWHRPILCFGAPLAGASEREVRERCRQAAAGDVWVTVSSAEEARTLAEEAARLHRAAHVEVKVDTGMGRMGVSCEEAVETIADLAHCSTLIVEGVYTHFATADEADLTFAREQLSRFIALRDELQRRQVPVRAFHAANSAAIFRLPEACRGFDVVRPGICLYGYWDGPAGERPAELVPAMRVVAALAAVRRVPAGHRVGYGGTVTTSRPSVLGVVPIGYADGYRRLLSNDAAMTLPAVRGRTPRSVPVVGRVSMDQTILDLTAAGDVRPGDPVVVIDDDPAAPNSVEAIARKLGTITYEITCLIGQRVRRVSVPGQ
ncbi:MAG: alanine racemase [Planctomycetes bacterium]|nr:alanine racemase [Planctomycetota bacterium]